MAFLIKGRQKQFSLKPKTSWQAMMITFIIIALLSACSPKPAQANQDIPTPDLTQAFENALLTATYAIAAPQETAAPNSQDLSTEPTQPLPPTPTTIPPTPIYTPYPLPEFQTQLSVAEAQPVSYLEEPCTYLQNKWGPDKSEPGTVVVPVMFHAIVADDKPITDNMFVSESEFHTYMNTAAAYDFEAISTQQLIDFLYNNAPIPRFSVIHIVDDRHDARYFNRFFLPYYEMFQWPVINAWINTPHSSEELWQQQVELNAAGWVDYQAHGLVHNIPIWEFEEGQTIQTDIFGIISASDFIRHEIGDPVTIFQERFGKRPYAYIWPGGGFSRQGVEVAREEDYKLGFSVYERGPLMYNWIPLGEAEKSVNDPLMVLPRYWSFAVGYQLEDVMRISEEAKNFAEQNKAQEYEYYRVYCPGYPALAQ